MKKQIRTTNTTGWFPRNPNLNGAKLNGKRDAPKRKREKTSRILSRPLRCRHEITPRIVSYRIHFSIEFVLFLFISKWKGHIIEFGYATTIRSTIWYKGHSVHDSIMCQIVVYQCHKPSILACCCCCCWKNGGKLWSVVWGHLWATQIFHVNNSIHIRWVQSSDYLSK